MMKNLLSLSLFVLMHFITYGQEVNTNVLSGEWLIRDIRITSLNSEEILDAKNNFWSRVKSTDKPVVINIDGSMTFFSFNESNQPIETKARYELNDGSDFKIYFMMGSAVSIKDGSAETIYAESYTPYEILYSGSDRFILKFTDHTVIEQYTFVKK